MRRIIARLPKLPTITTRPTVWHGTSDKLILGVSNRVSDYIEIRKLKMALTLHHITKLTEAPLTILMCEGAHVNAESLKYNNDVERAYDTELTYAKDLVTKFQPSFANHHVTYWRDLVNGDTKYQSYKNQIYMLYDSDPIFRELLVADAERTYTEQRKKEYPCQTGYLEKTILDLLEHCIYCLIISNKGYKYEFYHGKPYPHILYLSQVYGLEIRRVEIAIRM